MTVTGRWLLLVGCVVWMSGSAAWSEPATGSAGQPDRVEQFMGRYHLHPAFAKLGRGLSNLAGGWMEIPLNLHHHYSPQDTGGSLFTGAITGIFKGLVRTGVGAYETLTFFLPYPEHFAPILPTLEYFQRPPTRRPPATG